MGYNISDVLKIIKARLYLCDAVTYMYHCRFDSSGVDLIPSL